MTRRPDCYERVWIYGQETVNLQEMRTARLIIMISLCICFGRARGQRLTAETTGKHKAVRIEPQRSSGLESVYVVYEGEELTLRYRPTGDGRDARWLTFGNEGAANATAAEGEVANDGNDMILTNARPDRGYAIEEGNRRTYIWITNYGAELSDISHIEIAANDCSGIELTTEGARGELTYTSINGRRIAIDREIEVAYRREEYSEEHHSFIQREATERLANIDGRIKLPPPYCRTAFRVSGDRFLREWGMEQTHTTGEAEAVAVDAREKAEQDGETTAEPGGSAPVEVRFTAAVTEGAIYTEWQLADDPDFDNIAISWNEPEITYTFRESGRKYMRFVCANSDGSCMYTGEPYVIEISESMLRCPNAFTPGSSEGVNDEWKVSQRSIVEFDCVIFDRHGNRIAHLTDPDQGWDGKRNGRTVKAGVYYYVITARGSEGKHYRLSGDINIIGARRH